MVVATWRNCNCCCCVVGRVVAVVGCNCGCRNNCCCVLLALTSVNGLNGWWLVPALTMKRHEAIAFSARDSLADSFYRWRRCLVAIFHLKKPPPPPLTFPLSSPISADANAIRQRRLLMVLCLLAHWQFPRTLTLSIEAEAVIAGIGHSWPILGLWPELIIRSRFLKILWQNLWDSTTEEKAKCRRFLRCRKAAPFCNLPILDDLETFFSWLSVNFLQQCFTRAWYEKLTQTRTTWLYFSSGFW